MSCKPFAGVVVGSGDDLPTDGSVLLAMIEPVGGIRAHQTAALLERRPVVFVGGSTLDTYWDEATSQNKTLPSGWVQLATPV